MDPSMIKGISILICKNDAYTDEIEALVTHGQINYKF